MDSTIEWLLSAPSCLSIIVLSFRFRALTSTEALAVNPTTHLCDNLKDDIIGPTVMNVHARCQVTSTNYHTFTASSHVDDHCRI